MQENHASHMLLLVSSGLQMESLLQPKRLQNLVSQQILPFHSPLFSMPQSWSLECQLCFIACVSPWNSLFPDILMCHSSLLPSFLASLYKIVPLLNYIPLPYLIFHHSTWHCIACVFANLLIVSVSYGNMRPTRAGTWPSSKTGIE